MLARQPGGWAVSLLAAAAVLLIVAFQPFGKPKPRLGDRLGALTTAAAAAARRQALREAAGGADAIFDTPIVERTLGALRRSGNTRGTRTGTAKGKEQRP